GLESKGLLRIVPGKPERYMAVSPNDVLVPLVDKLNKETGECVQVVENLAMAFESSRYVYTEKPYERYDLWSVRGRDKVYKRIQDMIGKRKSTYASPQQRTVLSGSTKHTRKSSKERQTEEPR